MLNNLGTEIDFCLVWFQKRLMKKRHALNVADTIPWVVDLDKAKAGGPSISLCFPLRCEQFCSTMLPLWRLSPLKPWAKINCSVTGFWQPFCGSDANSGQSSPGCGKWVSLVSTGKVPAILLCFSYWHCCIGMWRAMNIEVTTLWGCEIILRFFSKVNHSTIC